MEPEFSIVTPSFQQPELLQLCSRSVLDQSGVTLEHIIQEGGSASGLGAWKPADSRVRLTIEPDRGMYDAINRGLRKVRGQIIGHLNADEQYLPGVLRKVAEAFKRHPDTEVLVGDAILVAVNGRPLSYRRIVSPDPEHTARIHLGTLTCSTFFRRSLLERGYFYPDHYRTIGDLLLVLNWLRDGVKIRVLHQPLALFTFTGSNLGASDLARQEGEHLMLAVDSTTRTPLWRLKLRHRLRKLAAGSYWPRRVAIDLYLPQAPEHRSTVTAWVGFYWPRLGQANSVV